MTSETYVYNDTPSTYAAPETRPLHAAAYSYDDSVVSYYGYRYYSSELGRWISRDPAAEGGGIGLYVFCHNSATDAHDAFGLVPWAWLAPIETPDQPPVPHPTATHPYTTYGQTEMVKWDVETVSFGMFCCKLKSEGCAQMKFWWARKPDGTTGRDHELAHVNGFKAVWDLFQSTASPFLPTGWIRCKRAVCYQDLIELMRQAFLDYAYAQEFNSDCAANGNHAGACDKAANHSSLYAAEAGLVEAKKAECDAL